MCACLFNYQTIKVFKDLKFSREKKRAEAWCRLQENLVTQSDFTQRGIFSGHFARDIRTKAMRTRVVETILLPGLLSCACLSPSI